MNNGQHLPRLTPGWMVHHPNGEPYFYSLRTRRELAVDAFVREQAALAKEQPRRFSWFEAQGFSIRCCTVNHE